jgi:acyl-CoA thioester hydrolase
MTPHLTADAFFFPVRVYYEDTDAGGVVYHSNYYKLAERARTEWLRALEIPGDVLIKEHKVHFVARRSNIEWKKPARLDDLLVIETRLSGLGKVRMRVRHTFRRDDVVLCIIEIELVCINFDFIPTPFPDALTHRLPAPDEIMEEKR